MQQQTLENLVMSLQPLVMMVSAVAFLLMMALLALRGFQEVFGWRVRLPSLKPVWGIMVPSGLALLAMWLLSGAVTRNFTFSFTWADAPQTPPLLTALLEPSKLLPGISPQYHRVAVQSISLVSFVLSGAVLYTWLQKHGRDGVFGCALLCIMPGAFFLTQPNAYALTLLFCLLCVYWADARRYGLSVLFGLLAVCTDITALALCGVLLAQAMGSGELLPAPGEPVPTPPFKREPRPAVAGALLLLCASVLYTWLHAAGHPVLLSRQTLTQWGFDGQWPHALAYGVPMVLYTLGTPFLLLLTRHRVSLGLRLYAALCLLITLLLNRPVSAMALNFPLVLALLAISTPRRRVWLLPAAGLCCALVGIGQAVFPLG